MRTKFFKLIGLGLVSVAALGLNTLSPVPVVLAQDPVDEALTDPVALGAWLYTGHCTRCHGPYEHERIGAGYRAEDALEEAIEYNGCQLKWGRQYDGPLKSKEISALTEYMLAWEALGQTPPLPELPAQPTPRPSPTPAAESRPPTPTPTPDPLTDDIRRIIESDEVVRGAWLYTQHCYRCHQSYAYYRQGKGMTADAIKLITEEGKTATQMTPFSRKNGGPLYGSEIDAIVKYIVTWEQLGTEPPVPPAVLAAPTPDPTLPTTLLPLPDGPPVVGNAQRGAELFALHCAVCHGASGEGQVGPALVKAWPSARPDLTIKAAIERGVPGSVMMAWSQAAGGPLDEAAINDLTTLILAWSQPTAARVQAAALGASSASAASAPWQVGVFMLVSGLVALVVVGIWRNA